MNGVSFGTKHSVVAIVLLLSPYFLGFTPLEPDSSWTEFRFGLGEGSYANVSRDCSGTVLSVDDVPFGEASASIDHYTSAFHLGLNTGVIAEAPARKLFTLEETWKSNQGVYSVALLGPVAYATPIVGLNTMHFGLDVGYVLPVHKRMFRRPGGIPAGSLRIGRKDAFHFRLRLADDLPLVSGGPGVGNLGFGFNLGKPRQSMWLGVGGAPYDGLMFGTQLELPLNDDILINLGGSIGGSESVEYGFSAGTRITL